MLTHLPPTFRALVDDAALFPPGLTPLPDAVVAHAGHLRSTHRELVGPFVAATTHLAALAEHATEELFPDGLPVSVVLASPAQVAEVVAFVTAAEHLVLAGLEVKLDPARPYVDQVLEIAATPRRGAVTYVEVPRPGHPEWPEVARLAAARGLCLKFRTGGTEAAAFPSEAEVAAWIVEAVGHGVPFKCTAGLHRAVRHTGAETGFEHHGYLNVLLATARADAGAPVADVEAALAERDARAVADDLAAHGSEVVHARDLFTSYGSCSILEPLDDLESLGLIHLTAGEGAPA